MPPKGYTTGLKLSVQEKGKIKKHLVELGSREEILQKIKDRYTVTTSTGKEVSIACLNQYLSPSAKKPISPSFARALYEITGTPEELSFLHEYAEDPEQTLDIRYPGEISYNLHGRNPNEKLQNAKIHTRKTMHEITMKLVRETYTKQTSENKEKLIGKLEELIREFSEISHPFFIFLFINCSTYF